MTTENIHLNMMQFGQICTKCAWIYKIDKLKNNVM